MSCEFEGEAQERASDHVRARGMGSVRFERTIGESGARCPTGLGHDPSVHLIVRHGRY